MKGFLSTLFFTMLLIAIAGAGIFAGYNAVNIRENKPIAIPLEQAFGRMQGGEVQAEILAKPQPLQDENIPKLLSSDAKLTFEYYNRGDGSLSVKEQDLPYFLAGKSITDLEEIFSDWQIDNYSESGAVLRKDIAGAVSQRYLVTAVDGYIAVFYDESIDGAKLKELTDTPISALAQSEVERLNSGILIQGEDALVKLLEDLSS